MSAGVTAKRGQVAREPDAATRGARVRGDVGWGWAAQAATGAVVLVLVAVHMVAQHFILPEGLRDYAQVEAWLRQPIVAAVETVFLASVTAHALLGVRAVLLDLGPSPRVERALTAGLGVIGVATVLYGLWLTAVVTGLA